MSRQEIGLIITQFEIQVIAADLRLDHHSIDDLLKAVRNAKRKDLEREIFAFLGDNYTVTKSMFIGPFLKSYALWRRNNEPS